MRKSLRIEEMDNARDALNEAIEQTLMIMLQKNVMEGSVGITLTIEMSPKNAGTYRPRIGYKTNVNVPLKMSRGGNVAGDQLYWDEDLHRFVLEVEGEQVKLL